MGKSSTNVPKDFGCRVAAFLRQTHPSKTAPEVAAATGCNIDAVEKWLSGVCAPNGAAMLRLFLAYGPEFLCAIIDDPPAWLDAGSRARRLDDLEGAIERQRDELRQLRRVSA